eukprot:jgi/Botrbrau1/16098/Bobra.7_2s0064.1
MLHRRVVKRSQASLASPALRENAEGRIIPQAEMADANDDLALRPAYVLEDDQLELPSDTLAALLLLRAQFPRTQAWQLPIALRSQVYSLVKERTVVDRELENLRHANKIRMFRLPLGSDPYCYCLTEDYVAFLQRTERERQDNGMPVALAQVYGWFADRVLPQCPDLAISKARLLELLSRDSRVKSRKRKADEEEGELVSDKHITLLLNSGFLARDASDRDGFVLGPGNVGPLVTSILKGRKELLGFLARRQYSQVLVKELEKKKMTRSPLGLRFHLRDLLGSGSVLRLQSTSGALVKLAKKK